jgi:hypothetical protein
MTEEGINAINAAAQIGVVGMDPLAFLKTTDGFERNLMLAVADRMMHYRQMLDKNLAVEIANQVGKLFKQ